jgi:hypothetical protein
VTDDELPGISIMFGECCSSQDWATAIGVPPSRLATDSTTSDCSGEKLPSGKYGTYAMCCSAVAASPAASARFAMLKKLCTHTTGAIRCALASAAADCRLRPAGFTRRLAAWMLDHDTDA